MSQKLINTRIGLKYDTYDQWTRPGTWSGGVFSDNLSAQTTYWEGFKPLPGEVIFFEIPSPNTTSAPVANPPAILFKVGDGVHYLNALEWGSAIAADVYNWAKQQSILSGTYDSQTDTWSFPTSQDPVITNTRKEVKDFISANTVDIQVRIIETGHPNEFQLQTSTDGKPADDPTKVWVNSGDPFSFEQATYTAGAGLQLTGNKFSINANDDYFSVTSEDGLDIEPSIVEFTSESGYDITATTGVLTDQAIGEIKDYVDAKAQEVNTVIKVVKQQTAETGYFATYYITQDDQQVDGPKINIPKDFLVKSAEVVNVVQFNGHYYKQSDTSHTNPLDGYGVNSEGKYIEFVVNTKDSSAGAEETYIYLAVNDLLNYTGGTGISIENGEISIDRYDGDIADATSSTGTDHFADAKQIKDFVDSEVNAAIDAAEHYTDEAIENINFPTHTAGNGIDITTTSSDGIDVNIAVKLGGTQNNPSGLAFQGSGDGEGGLIIDDTLIWVLQCGDSTFPIE